MPDTWQLRPIQAGDDAFLRRLYAQTRAAEIALAGWDDAAAAAFLRMQFDAQQRHYLSSYPAGCFDIVELAAEPVGRLYVARLADEIRVVDITLLAQVRNRGLGTRLLQALIDEAHADGARLTLQVEQHNPARALYRRLGFFETGPAGIYQPMQWRAPHADMSAPG